MAKWMKKQYLQLTTQKVIDVNPIIRDGEGQGVGQWAKRDDKKKNITAPQ
jgi:hypothetical protein